MKTEKLTRGIVRHARFVEGYIKLTEDDGEYFRIQKSEVYKLLESGVDITEWQLIEYPRGYYICIN